MAKSGWVAIPSPTFAVAWRCKRSHAVNILVLIARTTLCQLALLKEYDTETIFTLRTRVADVSVLLTLSPLLSPVLQGLIAAGP